MERLIRILKLQNRGAVASQLREVSVEVNVDFFERIHENLAFLGFNFIHYELPRSAAREKLMLAPVTAHSDAVQARFVSEAPRSSQAVPGNTYFYLVKGADLRVGARVVARVTTGNTSIDGVIVPNEAVVWHAGKSWVYRKQDADTFGRYEVSTQHPLGDGWFEATGLHAGDQVVVSGAQLLLSEELKFQIRNENED